METRVWRMSCAFTLCASMISVAGAAAAAPLGTNSLTPSAGDSTTSFALIPPPGSACSGGGAGVPSYRWQTYFVSADIDASTLKFASGPLAAGNSFVSPLYDSDGANAVVDRNPSTSPLGLISGIPTFSFAALVGFVPAGQYNIGFACTQAGVIEHGRYWETPITITDVSATSFAYRLGGAAPALQIGSAVPDEALITAERCSSRVAGSNPCGSR